MFAFSLQKLFFSTNLDHMNEMMRIVELSAVRRLWILWKWGSNFHSRSSGLDLRVAGYLLRTGKSRQRILRGVWKTGECDVAC